MYIYIYVCTCYIYVYIYTVVMPYKCVWGMLLEHPAPQNPQKLLESRRIVCPSTMFRATLVILHEPCYMTQGYTG